MKLYAVVGCWYHWDSGELQYGTDFEDAEFFTSQEKAKERADSLNTEKLSKKNASVDAHNERWSAEHKRLDYIKSLIPDEARDAVIFKNVPLLRKHLTTVEELDSHYTIISIEVKE